VLVSSNSSSSTLGNKQTGQTDLGHWIRMAVGSNKQQLFGMLSGWIAVKP
jgi:hypothetical protein